MKSQMFSRGDKVKILEIGEDDGYYRSRHDFEGKTATVASNSLHYPGGGYVGGSFKVSGLGTMNIGYCTLELLKAAEPVIAVDAPTAPPNLNDIAAHISADFRAIAEGLSPPR